MLSVIASDKIAQKYQTQKIHSSLKNIPISSSILYDLEYNNTLSLYSVYKNNSNKRRSYSEKNTTLKDN